MLLGGGGALFLVRAQQRKLRAETHTSYARLAAEASERARECERRERVLENKLDDSSARIRGLETEVAECRRLSGLLSERFEELRVRYPLAGTLDNIRRMDSAWSVICEWGIPIVLTTTENGGTFSRVTPAFASLLGMTPEEVVAAGPWNLLLAQESNNIERTRLAEADARAGEAVIISNTYRAADGRPVRLRWHATPYIMLPSLASGGPAIGFALSRVTERRKREDDDEGY